MHEKLRDRLLTWWSSLVGGHPWIVLAITTVLTLTSVFLSSTRLGFQSDRNALVSPSLSWNKLFIDWQQSFPGSNDLLVVVDAEKPASERTAEESAQAQATVDELGRALLASGHVQSSTTGAVWRFNQDQAGPRLMRLLPMDEFRAQLDGLRQAGPVIENPTPARMLASVEKQMTQAGEAANAGPEQIVAGVTDLRRLIEGMTRVLLAPPEQVPSLAALTDPAAASRSPWTYLTSEDGRLFFIRVTAKRNEGELNALAPAIAAVRELIARVEAGHPGLEIGLTGIEVVEADETDVATFDAAVASAVSLVLITGMLILAYHSVKTPLLAMLALSSGVAWAFGFTTLAIGHLQVLSVIFATMLLGISDAYGVHLAAKYELIRHDFPDTREGFLEALRTSFRTMGPGIITGAVVTSIGFFTTIFTDFRGVAEMGLISGVGIFLCLGAMFSVYPALISLFKWRHKNITPMDERALYVYDDRWVMPFVRRPKITLAVAATLLALSVFGITRMHFDYDLLKLQPRRVDSVAWAQRIIDEGGISIYTGSSIAPNLEEARRRTEAFRMLPNVESVRGVGVLFPEDEAEKLRLLREVRSEVGLTNTTFDPADDGKTDAIERLSSIRQKLGLMTLGGGLSGKLPPEAVAQFKAAAAVIDGLLQSAKQWEPEERQRRLAQLDRAYSQWRGTILAALDDAPLTAADLPAEVFRPYFATAKGDTRVVIEVFPRLPDRAATGIDSALHPRFLPGFIQGLRSVDPDVTGVIRQVYESGSLILWTYIKAGVVALLIILLVVTFDFRSVGLALMSLAPVAIGFAITFGVMWLWGMSINPANIMVLPLMFGIGVDSGVHILHRYRQDPATRPLGLSSGTGKAITVTALTTIIGFATLIFARHRGISSLGFVLTLGLSLTLLACLTVMPAWLELMSRRGARDAGTRGHGDAGKDKSKDESIQPTH